MSRNTKTSDLLLASVAFPAKAWAAMVGRQEKCQGPRIAPTRRRGLTTGNAGRETPHPGRFLVALLCAALLVLLAPPAHAITCDTTTVTQYGSDYDVTRSPSEYYGIRNRNTGRIARMTEKRPLGDFPTSETSDFLHISGSFRLLGQTPREEKHEEM